MAKHTYSSRNKKLQELLKEIRTDAGMSQVDLSRKLGQHQSFVSKYETGERRLDLIEIEQICEALGISLSGFVKRFEKKTNDS
jgi:transcriptional regulator with XRE-family HTH domain